jgi:branched-chain amino acid transport system ATP-binding protein
LASDAALALEAIDVFYGESHVLQQVSLALRPRSLLALLGRNGAGKTTSLNAVMGFLVPRRGRILLYGEPIGGLAPEIIARRGIGLVPQGRRIFPSLTVGENLAVAARGERRSRTIARVFATFPRLAERRDQHAGLLSGGEQQMLAIGRALVGSPRILLLDEPSEGLAPQIVAEVGRAIAAMKSEGLAIILVEQNVRLALSLADDVALLNAGRLVASGPAAAIAADPALIDRHLGVF